MATKRYHVDARKYTGVAKKANVSSNTAIGLAFPIPERMKALLFENFFQRSVSPSVPVSMRKERPAPKLIGRLRLPPVIELALPILFNCAGM